MLLLIGAPPWFTMFGPYPTFMKLIQQFQLRILYYFEVVDCGNIVCRQVCNIIHLQQVQLLEIRQFFEWMLLVLYNKHKQLSIYKLFQPKVQD